VGSRTGVSVALGVAPVTEGVTGFRRERGWPVALTLGEADGEAVGDAEGVAVADG